MLDLDATDDPLHGQQEGRFFHGYYDCYCYLPLYVFCGRHLLAARLRRANIDASAGAVEEVARIVGQIRARWPRVRIVLRDDSGFAREALMAWCEDNRVDLVFGLAAIRSSSSASTSSSPGPSTTPRRLGGVAQELPDILDRVQLGRARRQRQEREVPGHDERTGEMPSRPVVQHRPRLPGQQRLVATKPLRGEEPQVGRHPAARLQKDGITWNEPPAHRSPAARRRATRWRAAIRGSATPLSNWPAEYS